MARPGTKASRLAITLEDEENNSSNAYDVYSEVENNYRSSSSIEHRKRFAQFFTPQAIASLMCKWILKNKPKTVLDPAVGLGIFPFELININPSLEITGIDLDPIILSYARSVKKFANVSFLEADFLNFEINNEYDAIIANPPYLRHHDFSYKKNIFEEIGSRNNVKLSKLTNIYGLFILEICRRLKTGGRAAIIVPTEWTNANFGQAIKHFLLDRGFLKCFIYFSHDSLQFSDALTTACILLIEKPKLKIEGGFTKTIFLNGQANLDDVWECIEGDASSGPNIIVQNLLSSKLTTTKKWDFVIQNEALDHITGLVPLRKLAKTRRGIATGANEFFHVPYEFAVNKGIALNHLVPCIGKSADVSGLIFDTNDLSGLIKNNRRTHLIDISDEPNANEQAYLSEGEKTGLPKRYLLAARKKWYQMESRPPAPIWAAVFGRLGLRYIRNSAGIRNLTTFHCIYPFDESPEFSDALTLCLNSRFIQERSRTQHRVYGGGLLKVEPKDILEIEVPDISSLPNATIKKMGTLLKELNDYARAGLEVPNTLHDKIDQIIIDSLG